MTKTICDRCGKDIRGLPHCVRAGIFDNHIADLCRECYKELLDWVDGGKK